MGGVEALTRGFQIDEGTVFVNRTLVFGQADAEASEYNVGCFRIPAVVQTSEGVILAFAEGRIDSCHDCAVLGIAMKRSHDGGLTWSELSWPVPPHSVNKKTTYPSYLIILLSRLERAMPWMLVGILLWCLILSGSK